MRACISACVVALVVVGCEQDDATVINITEVVERVTEYVRTDVWHTTEYTIVEEDTTPDVVTIHEYHYPSGPVPALMLEEEGAPAMADGPLSSLAAATIINPADLMLISQSGTSKQAEADLIERLVRLEPSYGWHEHSEFTENLAQIPSWLQTTNGTGAAMSMQPAATQQRPGVILMETGTTASGYASLSKNISSHVLGVGEQEFSASVKVGVLSDATDSFVVYVGWGDSIITTADHVDGIYFKYSHSINSGKWQLVTANNSTRTLTDSGITVAANTFYNLKAVANSAGTSVEFFIDGSSVGVVTTNLPGSGRDFGAVMKIGKNAGTASRNLMCDYWHESMLFASAR